METTLGSCSELRNPLDRPGPPIALCMLPRSCLNEREPCYQHLPQQMETLKLLDSFRAAFQVLMWAISTASLLRRERNFCVWHSLDWTVQLSKHQVSPDPDPIPSPQPICIPPRETTRPWKILPQGFVFFAQCTAHSRCLIMYSQSVHPQGSPRGPSRLLEGKLLHFSC